MRQISRMSQCFPRQSGCYIIKNGELVLYIGQSKQMRKRWGEHHWKHFIEKHFPDATVEIVLCEQENLLHKELELIKEYKPIMNGKTDGEALKEIQRVMQIIKGM